jgi:probable HAF family extracellular repeat protein
LYFSGIEICLIFLQGDDKMGNFLKIVGILSLLLLAVAPANGAVEYTVQDLGDFAPTGMNGSGEVVGWRNIVTSGPEHAVLYSNGLIDLQTLGGLNSRAFGINDSGLVVGQSQISDGTYHAFISQNGPMIDLNSLITENAGVTLNAACVVNNKGQIAGICTTAGGQQQVFLYDNGSLNTYYFQGMDNITGINDNGLIIGNYYVEPMTVHGFILNDGILTDIDSKQGNITGPSDINSNGTIVGGFITQDGSGHAFFYKDGILTDCTFLKNDHPETL